MKDTVQSATRPPGWFIRWLIRYRRSLPTVYFLFGSFVIVSTWFGYSERAATLIIAYLILGAVTIGKNPR